MKFKLLQPNLHQYILLLSLLIYGLTAYNSLGYYHADEHYQIIEAAGLKLGTHTAKDLAWEINSQIRPTLQPSIAFVVIKFSHVLKIDNPYYQAFILRLLTAIIALLIIQYFIRNTEYEFSTKRLRQFYYLTSYLIYQGYLL